MQNRAVRFDHDYSAVTREVLEDGGDAATIETTGRVVFATFDINPAMFVGVVCCEVPFDALVDADAPRCFPALWRAAADRLRALRRPGRSACVTVRLAAPDPRRVLVRPYDWRLDGVAVSAPCVPGPSYAGSVDERPALTVDGAPFVILVAPGARRLEGSMRVFEDARAPRDVPLAVDLDVAPGARVALTLRPVDDAPDGFALRREG